MEINDKTKEQLIKDLSEKCRRIAELEMAANERNKVEDELIIKNSAIESSLSAIGITDASGKVLYVNDSLVRMWGYENKDEVLGRGLHEFWDTDRFNITIENTVKEGGDIGEDIGKRKDGSVFDVQFSSSLIKDKDGQPKYFFGSFLDISERKKAEDKIIESEIRYRTLFEQSPDAVVIIDPETTCPIAFNTSAPSLLGYTHEEFKKLRIADYEAIETPNEVRSHIEKVIHEGEGEFETKFITKKGIKKDVVVKIKVVELSGKYFLHNIFRDVTERKKAEKALQRTHDELELRVRERTLELQEKNIALKVLLKQREEDKNELEQNILSNIKSLIQPYIRKLKRNNLQLEDISYLNIIESNLEDIISPFSKKLSSNYLKFTSKEIEITNLIKDGKKGKEIMEIMNIAFDTVKSYRKNIRRKLGIYGKGTNLRTKLLSM